MVEITYRDALRQALQDAMREDDTIIVIGEEVGLYGGGGGGGGGPVGGGGARRPAPNTDAQAQPVSDVSEHLSGLSPV